MASAKAAHLRYVTVMRPDIRRIPREDEFVYIPPDNTSVADEAGLEPTKALGNPPEWTDVWISTLLYGHLQETRRYAKGC
ncbi:MAG: hypothetical protein NVSMB52_13060 [Chloroflexota bacterium]